MSMCEIYCYTRVSRDLIFISLSTGTTNKQLPGLIMEPLIFVIITYWLAGLRPTLYAFAVTALVATLVMNVSTACGCFFSAAFNSVPLAMAYLVPFDYILMITSGVFMKIGSLPAFLAWMPYISWLMYANEAMSIVQWQDVTNISKLTVNYIHERFIGQRHFQRALKRIPRCPVCTMATRCCKSIALLRSICRVTCG
jgi:ABC-2 type transporter